MKFAPDVAILSSCSVLSRTVFENILLSLARQTNKKSALTHKFIQQMKENGFVMDNKAESPNTEARHGVRVLKGSVRRPYRFPVIDEYMKERPFVLEHFLSVAGDVAFGNAVKRFDTDSGVDLITFARPQMREAMQTTHDRHLPKSE